MFNNILFVVLGLIILFFAVIIIRALCFKPYKQPVVSNETVDFDRDVAVENLRQLVMCKTISYTDKSLEDEKEFDKLLSLLPKLYPNVYANTELITFKSRGILLKWKGKSSEKPSVMMSHYDVVPVNEEGWSVPPFDGVIKDGVLWGRGTCDTKITLNGVMTAVDNLAKQGFIPENDVYLAFSGGEEVNGEFANETVDYFDKNGIVPELVVDEGGAVVENVFPGVKTPCALVGIAEKGMIDLKYTAVSNGGHASAPKPNTPVVSLAKACTKVEKKPFKMHLTVPVRRMFDVLGRHSTFVYKLIFANLWCFGWVLDLLAKKSGGEMNALLRTTVAFTQMEGSSAPNVLPPEAYMVSNMRLNPSDTVVSAFNEIKKKVSNDKISLEILHSVNPSRISQVDCDSYRKVESAIISTYKGAIVSPYLMVQCSDSRSYGKISDKVYRFSASDFTKEERAGIHGHNEKIRVDVISRAVEFYIRLLKTC
ncbi:MAG: M20/M25/M40 family metallo-hydrolase [Clostridia bacterium]|nr:M20/M25/M40 family metallo-hydrolase [Clostridia bacterium]